MKYLLDTCVWIRLLDAPENLSSDAQKILVDAESYPIGLATISLWEVARKESLGKLALKKPCKDWFQEAYGINGIVLMHLSHQVAWEACHLPKQFHNDPADQIIVATARLSKLTIITSDKRILNYTHVLSMSA